MSLEGISQEDQYPVKKVKDVIGFRITCTRFCLVTFFSCNGIAFGRLKNNCKTVDLLRN